MMVSPAFAFNEQRARERAAQVRAFVTEQRAKYAGKGMTERKLAAVIHRKVQRKFGSCGNGY